MKVLFLKRVLCLLNWDSVKTCLEYVKDSDMLILFIDTKAGSMISSEGKSVTHLEFLTAHEEGKKVLVYVNRQVVDEFFKLKKKLDEVNDLYFNNYRQFVNVVDTFETTYISDSYVLVLLYDLYQKGYYLNSFELGIDLDDQIKQHLSSIMKKSLRYLSIEKDIQRAMYHFSIYRDFYENSLRLVELIRNGKIVDARLLLSRLQNQMDRIVVEKKSKYQNEKITVLNPATAITLYSMESDEMVLVEYSGDVTAENIPLDNRDSYVVITATNPEYEEALFYNYDKNLFYFLFKVNTYVFCVHYPNDGEIIKEEYHDFVFNAILESKGYRYCFFLKKLMEG